ncbi:hypothetical protein D3C87_1724620 [compost metagenome]
MSLCGREAFSEEPVEIVDDLPRLLLLQEPAVDAIRGRLLERHVTIVPGTHPGGFERRTGRTIEIGGNRIDRAVVPGIAMSRLSAAKGIGLALDFAARDPIGKVGRSRDVRGESGNGDARSPKR